MKIKFNNEDKGKCLEMFKAIASTDKVKSYEGQEALAALVGPIVDQVLAQAATSRAIYDTIRYDLSDGAPSIPIDTYFGNTEGALLVWSQSMAGGLASNLVGGADEYRFTTHKVFSAVSFLKSYVAAGRLDVLSKGIERLAEEVLIKLEYQNWYVLLAALGQANTADGLTHILDSSAAGVFTIADLNRLMTNAKRLRKSWAGGTPLSSVGRGVTDLFVSPEIIEDIRAMSYNPMNVTAVPDTAESTALGLPDSMRLDAWNAGGAASFLGVRIHELLEFGVGQPYNQLFDQLYSGSPAFAQNTDELVLAVDTSVPCAFMVEAESGGSVFRTERDDQFDNKRSGKIGWFGECEVGQMIADTKALSALIV